MRQKKLEGLFLDKSYGIKVAWYGHFDKKLPIFKSVKMFESRPATTTCRQVLLLEKCSQTNVVECVYLLKKVVQVRCQTTVFGQSSLSLWVSPIFFYLWSSLQNKVVINQRSYSKIHKIMNAVPLKHNLINLIIDKFFSGSVTC